MQNTSKNDNKNSLKSAVLYNVSIKKLRTVCEQLKLQYCLNYQGRRCI